MPVITAGPPAHEWHLAGRAHLSHDVLAAQRATCDRLLVAARAVAADRAAVQQLRHRVNLAADGAVAALLARREDDPLHSEGLEGTQAAHTRLREAKAVGIALRRALELAPLGEHAHDVEIAAAQVLVPLDVIIVSLTPVISLSPVKPTERRARPPPPSEARSRSPRRGPTCCASAPSCGRRRAPCRRARAARRAFSSLMIAPPRRRPAPRSAGGGT